MTVFRYLFFSFVFLFYITAYSQISVERAFPNLNFTLPMDLQISGDSTNRLFVVEQIGRIIVFDNSSDVTLSKVFLDITDRVVAGGQKGLIGLAFHPDYKTNRYFYVYYTDTTDGLRSVVSRFTATLANPDSANKNSELILLTHSQPFPDHNGGQMAFGPDGYLYIAFGDGGRTGPGDPFNNGQNLTTFLGKILRIDVNNTQGSLNYAIPPDNPYEGNSEGYKEEIFAYGFRNPWRFSFDLNTDLLWAADVGQDSLEEIDLVENGGNYGWRLKEGSICYNPPSGCDTVEGLIDPLYEYRHNAAGGESITGGYVYRGADVPELYGKYVYGDFISKRIWALTYDGINPPSNELLFTSDDGPISFAQDKNKELFMLIFGDIYKFSPTADILAPSNLNAYSGSPDLVQLTWIDNSDNEIGFLIQRRTFSGTFTTIDSAAANATSFNDNSVTLNTAYYYRIAAFNSSAASGYSNVANVNVPVPVELISFTADALKDKVQLIWITATETNNYGFEIQRSNDDKNWNAIGFVTGFGSSSSPITYTFTDKSPSKRVLYYRLNQKDYNGTFKIYNSIKVDLTIDQYALEQNYPNPFNPTTKIKYTIAAPGNSTMTNVNLKIYDILGNLITTFVNESQTPGIYEVVFNASDLPSGVYYYKLTAGEFTSTKKMMVIK